MDNPLPAIASIAKHCSSRFEILAFNLSSDDAKEHRKLMPVGELDCEHGRYKIWCGNLGALQRGHASLDARLRESLVVRKTILDNLQRLGQTLQHSIDVVTGLRLAFDEQAGLEDSSDSEQSEDETEDQTELEVHLATIKDILLDLYRLSFKIRSQSNRPSTRSKGRGYTEIDKDSGIDKFDAYSEYDRQHVKESIRQLRRAVALDAGLNDEETLRLSEDETFLMERLVATMCLRRRTLAYWQRRALKLAEVANEKIVFSVHGVQQAGLTAIAQEGMGAFDRTAGLSQSNAAESVIEKTVMSATTATNFDATLDDRLETKSQASALSTTVRLYSGSLPPPPPIAARSTEFKCPYCGVVCPAKQGIGQGWQAHIAQDLRPYFCTYAECSNGDTLYGSSKAWLEHERLQHRRIWQCFKHADAQFASQESLQHHLESEHNDSLTDDQIQTLLDASKHARVEDRNVCPFCMSSNLPRGLESHMARHMLDFATFAIHAGDGAYEDSEENEADVASARAQGSSDQSVRASVSMSFGSPALSVEGIGDSIGHDDIAKSSTQHDDLGSNTSNLDDDMISPRAPDLLTSPIQSPHVASHPGKEYQYHALDHSRRQIRLLTFQTRATDVLECRIEHCDFDSCPPYFALSYLWGNPTRTRTISVARLSLHVTQYLYEALDCLSNSLTSKSTKRFWIDQVCIDQNNAAEKNHQVGMMRVIYTRAASVVVWLGLGLSQTLKLIGNDTTLGSSNQLNLEKLAKAPVWSRLWAVMEFVLGKSVMLASDDTIISWENVEMSDPCLADTDMLIAAALRTQLGELRRAGFYRSLPILMKNLSSLRCVDPRDKLYSPLMLFQNEGEDSLEIDYSITAEELNAKVLLRAKSCLSNEEFDELSSLLPEVLGLAETATRRVENDSLSAENSLFVVPMEDAQASSSSAGKTGPAEYDDPAFMASDWVHKRGLRPEYDVGDLVFCIKRSREDGIVRKVRGRISERRRTDRFEYMIEGGDARWYRENEITEAP